MIIFNTMRTSSSTVIDQSVSISTIGILEPQITRLAGGADHFISFKRITWDTHRVANNFYYLGPSMNNS